MKSLSKEEPTFTRYTMESSLFDIPEWELTLDNALSLLHDCRFKPKRSREKAEKALELLEIIKDYLNGSLHSAPRGLISFPDLLERYLKIAPIDEEDLKSMFCRCIEQRAGEKKEEKSLEILLDFYREKHISQLDILLLPGKYSIDLELYQKCKQNGIRDIYFVYISDNYHHNLDIMESDLYFGYRNAYHGLLYAGKKCQVLLNNWDSWTADCSTEAAFDFFEIPYGNDYQEKYKNPESGLRETLLSKMKANGNL